MSQVSQEILGEIAKLFRSGLSIRQIATITGFSKSTIGRKINQLGLRSKNSLSQTATYIAGQKGTRTRGKGKPQLTTTTGHKKTKSGPDIPKMTGKIWTGETPITGSGNRRDVVLNWNGPKVEPSFYNFRKVFHLDDPTKYPIYFPPGKVHKEICDVLESAQPGDILQILMARDHYKTTIVQRDWAIYNICQRTDEARKGILYATYDPELAEQTFEYVIQVLTQNPYILSFFGYLVDDERRNQRGKKKKFKTGNVSWRYQPPDSPPGLQSTGYLGGGITGQHPGIAALDDIEDEDLSWAKYRKYKKIFLKKLIPAASKTGYCLITGTIKGWLTAESQIKTQNCGGDIYLVLKANDEVLTYEYPAVTDKDGNPAFPPMKDVVIEKSLQPVINKRGKTVINFKTGKPKMRVINKIVEIKNRDRYIVTYPEKFSLEDLVRLRLKYRFGKDTTDGDFFSEYLLQPNEPSGKYFKVARISNVPPKIPTVPHLGTFEDLRDYCKKFHYTISCWLDPGGKDAHGVAIVVGTTLFGRFIFFDFKVVRAPLSTVARELAELLEYWRVDEWGIEANFGQDQLYGDQIDEYLYNYLVSQGKTQLYKQPSDFDNHTNKVKRIDSRISIMLGYETDPIRCFINPDADDYEQFMNEFRAFGGDASDQGGHQWDILDGMASMHVHQFDYAGEVYAETGG